MEQEQTIDRRRPLTPAEAEELRDRWLRRLRVAREAVLRCQYELERIAWGGE